MTAFLYIMAFLLQISASISFLAGDEWQFAAWLTLVLYAQIILREAFE